jgi:hypothetical protein
MRLVKMAKNFIGDKKGLIIPKTIEKAVTPELDVIENMMCAADFWGHRNRLINLVHGKNYRYADLLETLSIYDFWQARGKIFSVIRGE